MIIKRQNKWTQLNLDLKRYSPLDSSKYFLLNNNIPDLSYTLSKKKWKKENKYNEALLISIKDEPDKGFFELVKDEEPDLYTCHFKTMAKNGLTTETGKLYVKFPITTEEKDILFKGLINAIPIGGKVSTWGKISKGGYHALWNLGNISNKKLRQIGIRKVTNENGDFVDIPIWIKVKK